MVECEVTSTPGDLGRGTWALHPPPMVAEAPLVEGDIPAGVAVRAVVRGAAVLGADRGQAEVLVVRAQIVVLFLASAGRLTGRVEVPRRAAVEASRAEIRIIRACYK